jgi:sugar O-acyltransferase (sialic acid O-acetyltransferase NeuD family)
MPSRTSRSDRDDKILRNDRANLVLHEELLEASMLKTRNVVIIGDGSFAEVAYEYFTHDSSYEVVGFSVEKEHRTKDRLFGLDVLPFETLERVCAPETCDVFVAIGFMKLNRVRTTLAGAAKEKGFRLASYVSSRAFVWRNVTLGEHAFIFEDNTIQPFVRIGNNVTLWSGNHIGHHCVIGDNAFISSHVVLSGQVHVGENCFFGVNSSVAHNVRIGRDCWISPGVVILRDAEEGAFFRASKSKPEPITAPTYFKVEPESQPVRASNF